jgi:hypothetical protein
MKDSVKRILKRELLIFVWMGGICLLLVLISILGTLYFSQLAGKYQVEAIAVSDALEKETRDVVAFDSLKREKEILYQKIGDANYKVASGWGTNTIGSLIVLLLIAYLVRAIFYSGRWTFRRLTTPRANGWDD